MLIVACFSHFSSGLQAQPSPSSLPLPDTNTMEESTSNTISSLKSALANADESVSSSIFVSEEVLRRPPFPYFYGLVKFLAQERPSLGWEQLLIAGDVQLPQCFTKKEKVRCFTVHPSHHCTHRVLCTYHTALTRCLLALHHDGS